MSKWMRMASGPRRRTYARIASTSWLLGCAQLTYTLAVLLRLWTTLAECGPLELAALEFLDRLLSPLILIPITITLRFRRVQRNRRGPACRSRQPTCTNRERVDRTEDGAERTAAAR
eukprot:scaffold27005_cov132-Isochrysis_galbana.AAC.5